jgi:hypothetical protein
MCVIKIQSMKERAVDESGLASLIPSFHTDGTGTFLTVNWKTCSCRFGCHIEAECCNAPADDIKKVPRRCLPYVVR